jgi:hypothetical protein
LVLGLFGVVVVVEALGVVVVVVVLLWALEPPVAGMGMAGDGITASSGSVEVGVIGWEVCALWPPEELAGAGEP